VRNSKESDLSTVYRIFKVLFEHEIELESNQRRNPLLSATDQINIKEKDK